MDFFSNHMSLRARYWSLKNNSTESKTTLSGLTKLTITSVNFRKWKVVARACSTLMANLTLGLSLILVMWSNNRLIKVIFVLANTIEKKIFLPVVILRWVNFNDISKFTLLKILLGDNDVIYKKRIQLPYFKQKLCSNYKGTFSKAVLVRV